MFSRSSPFDKALEKGTSQLQLEIDWDIVLQICDMIRQEDISPKYALSAIKRKVSVENPHVSMFALQILESVVKNCGALIHKEIATRDFMEYMKDLCKTKTDLVKTKILELVQIWSHAFRNETTYKVVTDTFNILKAEGYSFPALKEADAMFSAEKAPEWKESDNCARCRTAFGTLTRKHHCRNCGDVFCHKCSSKSSIIPKFGIEREVRVCDHCYDTLNPMTAPKKDADTLPAEYLASPLSRQSQAPPSQTEQELKEKEDLELALALSQSEQESKPHRGILTNMASTSGEQPRQPTFDTSQMDPELAHYLNRNYWEKKNVDSGNKPSGTVFSTTTPSAPAASSDPTYTQVKVQEQYQNGETDEQEQFINALLGSVEIFVNRMKSNSMRGRSIANDTSVQSLFTVISNMHPQLMTYLQNQDECRGKYETLQDKLAQLRDAREALDALREDHAEKKRLEYEEMERRRQIQMAHKLEIMRQKKHEYLEAQRQHALQKLQEQERELQMRYEKQLQLTQMRQMEALAYPQKLYSQAMGQSQQPVMGQGQPPGIVQGQQLPMGQGPQMMNAGPSTGQTMPESMQVPMMSGFIPPGAGPVNNISPQTGLPHPSPSSTSQGSGSNISGQNQGVILGPQMPFQQPAPGPGVVSHPGMSAGPPNPQQAGIIDPRQISQGQVPGSYQGMSGGYMFNAAGQAIPPYQPFNMQGMTANVPSQSPPNMQQGQSAPGQNQPQDPGQINNSAQPAQFSSQGQPQRQADVQLISFD